MTAAMRHRVLTIAELYAQPALMDLPTFFKACGIAESTGYQLAAEGRLPIEVIPLGRRRFVRTADVLAWLHLSTNGDGPGAATPDPLAERTTEPTAK